MSNAGGPEQPESPQQPEQGPPTHESGWPPPPGYLPPRDQPADPTQQYGQPGQYQQPYQYGGQPYGQPHGQPYGQSYGGYRQQDDPGAQTSLIVGIIGLGLGLMCGIGFLASPVAWVMGARSKRRIDASQGRLGGRGNAQAGMVLGIVGTVLLALAILAMIAFVVLVIAGIASDPGWNGYELDGTAA